MRYLLLFLSVFLASIVEGVEALTIVLAVGTTRSWRSTWYGVGAALIVLTTFIAILGPALTSIPLDTLRLIIGGLLLIFGLQWLKKAILRASGFKPLHNEAAIYAKATEEARLTKNHRIGAIDDWYSFTVAFKGVVLEGLEIAFIVVTFGANQKSIPLAILGAISAVIIVIIVGIAVHKPLSTIPENSLKFIVGIMLASFGIFWGSEGAGIIWPGNDISLIGIIALIVTTSLAQIYWLKHKHVQLNQLST